MADAQVRVMMLVVSGTGVDSQWFDYRPGFTLPVIRIEWEKGTMSVVLPADVASYLVTTGYARPLTADELKEYPLEGEKP